VSFPLYLDEDVDVELAELLRADGYDVLTTVEAGRAARGLSDESQLEFATQRGRAIFTHNVRDFLPIAGEWAAQQRAHAGIIVTGRRPLSVLREGLRFFQTNYPDGIGNLCLRPPSSRARN
jgi:hypothetical protein